VAAAHAALASYHHKLGQLELLPSRDTGAAARQQQAEAGLEPGEHWRRERGLDWLGRLVG